MMLFDYCKTTPLIQMHASLACSKLENKQFCESSENVVFERLHTNKYG